MNGNGSTERKGIADISMETQLLVRRLRDTKIGDLLTYEDLSKVARRPVGDSLRGPLTSARRKLLREERIAFVTIAGTGIRRATDEEKVAMGVDGMSRMRRQGRRSLRQIYSVENFDAMPPEVKVQHNVTATVLNLFVEVSGAKKQKQLTAAVEKQGNMLPLEASLEHLK
jgi:hypothetical protein